MKILALYPYLPFPLNRGAYHRAFHLLKGMASDHQVDLLALAEDGEGADYKTIFQEFCREVVILPFQHPQWEKLFPKRLFNPLPSTIAHWSLPPVKTALRELISRERYDAVHVLDLVLTQSFLNEFLDLPLVLDRTRVDLQYQLMEHRHLNFSLKNRLLNLENCLKLWRFEKAVAKRCALQVVCGPDDKTFVRNYISRDVPIEVIPNGVDLQFFNADNRSETRALEPTILFCGAMDYNPNIDALRWFFTEMHAPLRKRFHKLQVLVVGKDPVAEVKTYCSRPGVTVTGGVPDVRPYYKRAWLQIVPLRIGGGTRLKIVESLAIGTPVVSTTIGAQGLHLRHNADILLADTAEAFVNETARALQDSELRARLQTTGLQTVRAYLSWNKLGHDLSRVYFERLPVKTSSLRPTLTPAISNT